MKDKTTRPSQQTQKKHLAKSNALSWFSELGTKGDFLNLINAIGVNSTSDIILSDERLKAYLLRTGTRQGYRLLPLGFNTAVGVLTGAVRWDKNKSE